LQSADGSKYGEARLLDVVRTYRSLSAPELAARIVDDVKAFSTLEQSDDWTLIAASARRT
jgi:serine phosphatase RsbU (regulator of sigma subunit)